MKLESFAATPVYPLWTDESGNQFFIKREDLLPYSFGGNKARIGAEYLRDMQLRGGTHMVAYGNARSNLCRVLSNLCAGAGVPITILSPADDDGQRRRAFNGALCESFGARIVPCLKTNVAETVDQVLADIRAQGGAPYYVNGDRYGKGNEAVPVRAYARAWREIAAQDEGFDLIVLALGTGMTQAGLLCGQLALPDGPRPQVLGISIARDEAAARTHVHAYADAYQASIGADGRVADADVHICDRFRSGYGRFDGGVAACIRDVMARYGIPLDGTYTGKAFHGMVTLCREEGWKNRRVLFLHTGGTPLFFDAVG